jgi:hypothetical protein
MEPKLKAIELVKQFLDIGLIVSSEAKQCALIAVDEIILTEPMIEGGESDSGTEYKPNDDYWQEVKQEIEQL